MKPLLPFIAPACFATVLIVFAGLAHADPLNCNLSAYRSVPGLNAAVTGNSLVVTWEGEQSTELRLRFGIEGGVPTIQELAIHPKGGAWRTLANAIRPD